MKLFLSGIVLLGLVERSFQCSIYGELPSNEEIARSAPLVIKAYLIWRPHDWIYAFNSTRCLHVAAVYKGQLDSTYICATGFGFGSMCRSDLNFDKPYVVFLNDNAGVYSAYNVPLKATVLYSQSVFPEVSNGVCCSQGDCHSTLACSLTSCGSQQCKCQPKGKLSVSIDRCLDNQNYRTLVVVLIII